MDSAKPKCPFGANRHACECDDKDRARTECPYRDQVKKLSKREQGDEVGRMLGVRR